MINTIQQAFIICELHFTKHRTLGFKLVKNAVFNILIRVNI